MVFDKPFVFVINNQIETFNYPAKYIIKLEINMNIILNIQSYLIIITLSEQSSNQAKFIVKILALTSVVNLP